MTLSNELRTLRGEADLESIERRLSDLESKVEDIEAVLSVLCVPRKKPGVLNSWFRALVHRANLTPGSTIGPV